MSCLQFPSKNIVICKMSLSVKTTNLIRTMEHKIIPICLSHYIILILLSLFIQNIKMDTGSSTRSLVKGVLMSLGWTSPNLRAQTTKPHYGTWIKAMTKPNFFSQIPWIFPLLKLPLWVGQNLKKIIFVAQWIILSQLIYCIFWMILLL